MAETWEAWAGAWAEAALPKAGAPRQRRRGRPMHGKTVELEETLEQLAPTAQGHLRLRRVARSTGDDARAAFDAMLQEGAPPGREALRLSRYSVETTVELEADPRSLVPVRSELLCKETVVVEGRPPAELVERRTWTFKPLSPEESTPR